MKQNEFEQQVKIQMDELDLSPSDEVWIEVERRIRKEKKRRFIFWWPLFACLLAGGVGVYFFVNNGNNKKEANTKHITANTPNKPAEKKNTEPHVSAKINTVSQTEAGIDRPAQLVNENGGNNPVPYDKRIAWKAATDAANGNGIKLKSTNRQSQKEKQPLLLTNSFLPAKENEPGQAILPVSVNKEKTNVVDYTVQQTDPNKSNVKPAEPNEFSSPVINKTTHIDSINKSVQLVAVTEKQDSAVVAVVPDNTIKLKKKNNWQWGGSVEVGSSALANGFGLLEKSALFDATTFINSTNASLNTAGNSSAKRGVTFTGSLFIQKQVNAKSTLRFFVSYNYLSWRFNVGSRVDSTFAPGSASTGSGIFTSGYYRAAGNAGGRQYTNSYHLLGAAAEFSMKVIQGKKINLYWDNSLSYKRIIASNMLHYSSTLAGYYQDNKLLQKNQLFFSTAFLLQANNRFSIGPFLQYGITPALKNEQSPGRHFNSVGIRTIFLFGK